jgi:hypothetical protein
MMVRGSVSFWGLGRRHVDECGSCLKLFREERHNEFGHDVNGQIWEMGL